ncbi:hypothetical protein OUZ56_008394 [Daphnia magna]|uniref:Uncharacterized protein n=1 Tax=Daphnia magna TaxID=35525 RepID=A0ABR0ACW5_9CRUS|nr:hypothetical protein OUZ56_008394 [Daphnia magna]
MSITGKYSGTPTLPFSWIPWHLKRHTHIYREDREDGESAGKYFSSPLLGATRRGLSSSQRQLVWKSENNNKNKG